ncbi:acylneuraminate cytidylyltransferase family protein [Roseomonas marmotae]|uniref:NTP transferase domain-containing protein n=1 Tax=Roseomonas marmotae TaxID=2768161 RepID=A0ABS3KE91_9PROT|nr:NTP transferase domain-containing protein [Roseomonas marmotae]MBO1075794.1 NTP transferase domain-containing protein [Roseomonas marmotae]QTI80518.1 NTP transferase domain-containing protein [Roseomonas marmotae]
MSNIAMIPARLGSQRLKQKNLLPLKGAPLIAHAIRKCLSSGVFDEVWVNSEADEIARIAEAEGAKFHRRPAELANNVATSEQFVAEFLDKHPCERVFQVHSIAPLLTIEDIAGFVRAMEQTSADVMLSVVDEPLEALCRGEPVNFTFAEKTNSQDLPPVRRITWSVTGWRRQTYLDAVKSGGCATYAGKVELFSVDRLAGHVIKHAEDLAIAEALFDLVHQPATA